jgi:uncharacterized alpha-E superfamily protein
MNQTSSPMLSRVADSLYWMSRYIERAEHTSRLIDVNLKQMLDESPEMSGLRWSRVISCLRTDPPKEDRTTTAVVTWMMFDLTNPDSIATCVAVARENARQIREALSADFWENINRLHLYVRQVLQDPLQRREPHEFLRRIRIDIHVLHGIEDSTLVRSEGWNFIQAGKAVERAAATTALLAEHAQEFLDMDMGGDADGFLHWVSVLRSCTAFEAYIKTYTAELHPGRVLEFLLLNPQFPRSVSFCLTTLHECIQGIEVEHGFPRASQAVKLARRLVSLLEFWEIDELMGGDLRTHLSEVESFCGRIHSAIEEAYIFYPSAPSEIREGLR